MMNIRLDHLGCRKPTPGPLRFTRPSHKLLLRPTPVRYGKLSSLILLILWRKCMSLWN